MKKKKYMILIGLILLLSACGKVNEQQDEKNLSGTEENNITVSDTEQKLEEDQPLIEAPTKEEVIKKREFCLEGMTDENIRILKEKIKFANQVLENACFYDNIFEKLANSEDLFWNYIDQKGEIVIGYAFEEGEEYQKSSGLSFEEYAMKFGQPVKAYNKYDAESFIKLMEELKDTIYCQSLKEDFDKLIECMDEAKDTHDVKYVQEIYYILHDMDYYLLRYAPEDIGPYVQDRSMIDKYYGVLEVYKSNESKQTEALEEQIDIETAWQHLKESYFSSSELNEISYDAENKFKAVIYRGEMEFSSGDKERPFENVVFFDHQEDDDYIFGNYLVFYNGEEIFGLRTRGWYSVNSYTGEVTLK